MEIAILGLPQSGKSTLFEIMTGVCSRERFGEPTVRGMVRVPDTRFDELVRIFSPAKVSPAQVPFIDVNATGEDAWSGLRNLAGTADGMVHVLDAFTFADVDEIVKHYRKLADELVISDLMIVENRLARLAKTAKTQLKPEDAVHADVLPRLKEALEAGTAAREMAITPNEQKALRSFALWTLKPELIVLNTAEGNRALVEEFIARTKITTPVVGICAQMEMEIAELSSEERAPFLEEMGIAEPAFERIIQNAFTQLERICYFTVGEDEVKAWVIPAGSTAPKAASAIHKDFERGFIKAEVVAYDDFIASGGTLAAAKAAGRMRLEGKEYIVKDGDIISFRFNV